jgi:hypothetical protein
MRSSWFFAHNAALRTLPLRRDQEPPLTHDLLLPSLRFKPDIEA